MSRLTVAISGMNAGESPQPGPAVARALRLALGREVRLVGLLYDAMESGVFVPDLLDDAFVVPYPSSGTEALHARLDYLAAQLPIAVLIPTLDAELPAYTRLAPALARRGIRMFLPTEEQLEARGKAQLADLARRLALPFPRQQLIPDLEVIPQLFAQFAGEVMVKGVLYDAKPATSAAAAVAAAAKIAGHWGFPLIMQERLAGGEYDLLLLGDGEGHTLGAVGIKKMALTDKGKAFSGMTIRDETLLALGREFVRRTKWRGPLEMEFIKADRDGRYYLIEINPRFPAWCYLAAAVGQNMPLAVVRLAQGEAVPPFPDFSAGKFFVRHAIDLVADLPLLEQLTVAGEVHR